MSNIKEAVYADNCGACGTEYLSYELIPIKIGSYSLNVKVCLNCLTEDSDTYQQYKSAAEIILQITKE